MSEQPDELRQAERRMRQFAVGDWIGNYFEENKAAGVVMAELTRLRGVEQAAAALVEHWEAIRNPADKLVWTISEQLTEKLADTLSGAKR
jgi:hypothetical protein